MKSYYCQVDLGSDLNFQFIYDLCQDRIGKRTCRSRPKFKKPSRHSPGVPGKSCQDDQLQVSYPEPTNLCSDYTQSYTFISTLSSFLGPYLGLTEMPTRTVHLRVSSTAGIKALSFESPQKKLNHSIKAYSTRN